MQRIYLFRHGETDWNVQRRFQGHSDIELNATGRQQARDLVPYFRRNPVAVFLSSDLLRAEETARIVAQEFGAEVLLDARLREIHFGAAEGLTKEEILDRWGARAMQAFYSVEPEDDDFEFPGGESKLSGMVRAMVAMESFLKTSGHAAVGVASHGGILRRLLKELAPAGGGPERIHNGDVFELHWDAGRWTWPRA